ncbi:MAG: pre-peptidase C-terminal domain-containing protein [Aggregatilineales bacterium]
MRHLITFLIAIILMLGVFVTASAQGDGDLPLPSFPGDEISYNYILFPDAPVSGSIENEETITTYLFYAEAGETVLINLERTEGTFLPYLSLMNSEGQEIATQFSDLRGLQSILSVEIEHSDWYYVGASSEPNSTADPGRYRIMLSGSSYAIFSVLQDQLPPRVDNGIIILEDIYESTLNTGEGELFFWLNAGDSLALTVSTETTQVNLTTLNGDSLVDDNVTEFTSDDDLWINATVSVVEDDTEFQSIINRAEGSVAVAYTVLNDLATITPSPTLTATYTLTPTATFTPTLTPSQTFTPSTTPTPSNTPIASNTPTSTFTSTPSRTPTATNTRTNTPRPSSTPIPPPTSTVPSIEYGETITARTNSRSSIDYTFSGTSGDVVTISLDSNDFDTYLELFRSGRQVTFDDDGGSGLNSMISNFTLPSTDTYTIRVRAFNNRSFSGDYTLTLTENGNTSTSNVINYNQSLSRTTRSTTGIDYIFSGTSGDVVTISLDSSDFDTYLELFRNGRQVTFDDDGGSGLNSMISNFTLPSTDTYTIRVRAFNNRSFSGTFTLSLQSSSTSGGTTPPDSTRQPPSVTCPNTLASRLVAGDIGRVVPNGRSNRMRSDAGTGFSQVGQISSGGVFEVIDGPECSDGYAWYQVNHNGTIGWTAEADTRAYWIELLDPTGGPSMLTGGIGQTNGARQAIGEFQVEYFCTTQGYGITNDNNNWYCTQGGSRITTLSQSDFDRICRDTYDRSDAYAIQLDTSAIPAYSWRCFGNN